MGCKVPDMLLYMISNARAKVGSQQGLMFNYLDLHEILISRAKYLAPPKPLSPTPTPPAPYKQLQKMILKEKMYAFSREDKH